MRKARGYCLFVNTLLGTANGTRVLPSAESAPYPPEDFAGDAIIWVRSNPKYVSAIRALLSSVCADTGLSEQDRDDLKLALGEAVCNAIQHGSPHGTDDYVGISFNVQPQGVTVCVADTGHANETPEPCRREDLRDRGYGLLLIQKLTSAFRIQCGRRGTTVTMEKRFPARA
jgi:anti-sigma regulatory factor (Ser/Thr protein kinase)